MRDRFSVIGFTEAELGFIAAILLFAALSTQRTHVPKREARQPIAESRLVVPKTDFEELRRMYDEELEKNRLLENDVSLLQKKLATVQDQLNKLSGLRSHQKPSCVERHVAQRTVGEVLVIGVDQFQVENVIYDLDALLDHFSPQLEQARAADCVQSIGIVPSENISSRDYVRASNRLGQSFYLVSRPAS